MRDAGERARKLASAIFPAFFCVYFLAAIYAVGGWPVLALACAFSAAAYFYEAAAGAAWSGPLVGAVLFAALLLGIWPFENEALLFATRRWAP